MQVLAHLNHPSIFKGIRGRGLIKEGSEKWEGRGKMKTSMYTRERQKQREKRSVYSPFKRAFATRIHMHRNTTRTHAHAQAQAQKHPPPGRRQRGGAHQNQPGAVLCLGGAKELQITARRLIKRRTNPRPQRRHSGSPQTRLPDRSRSRSRRVYKLPTPFLLVSSFICFSWLSSLPVLFKLSQLLF